MKITNKTGQNLYFEYLKHGQDKCPTNQGGMVFDKAVRYIICEKFPPNTEYELDCDQVRIYDETYYSIGCLYEPPTSSKQKYMSLDNYCYEIELDMKDMHFEIKLLNK